MLRLLRLLATVGLVTAFAACSSDDSPPPSTSPGTLAEVAQSNGFSALVAAASKAGLTATLSAPNANLTVFAPTDAAFATLAGQLGFASASAMVDALPANALANILTYHVLPSRKSAADLAAGGTSLPTAYTYGSSAATLDLVSNSGGLSLGDAVLTTAKVTTADVPASNGVIHVIDKVILPPAP